MLWAAASAAWSWLAWLFDWFWWLTVKPSLYLLGAGALWHLGQRWFYRLLARQLARPRGWFGRNVSHALLRDLNGSGVRWAFSRLPLDADNETDLDGVDGQSRAGDDDLNSSPDESDLAETAAERPADPPSTSSSSSSSKTLPAALREASKKRQRRASTTAKRILEVGCGGGLAFEPFMARFPDPSACVLEGLDVSSEALEHCEEISPCPTRIHLTQGDAQQLPWGDNSFDGVLAFHLIDVLAAAGQDASALEEMARCLRPGGVLALTTKEPSAYLRSAEAQAGLQQGVCRVVTNAYVQAALRRAGLEIILQETQTLEDCKADTKEGDPLPIPSVLTIGRKPR